MVGDDHVSARLGEQRTVGRGDVHAEESGDAGRTDEELIARAHERTRKALREERHQRQADTPDDEPAEPERQEKRRCEAAARQSDGLLPTAPNHLSEIIPFLGTSFIDASFDCLKPFHASRARDII